MKYRGYDENGRKYLLEFTGQRITIDDGERVIKLLRDDWFGTDYAGRDVYEGDTIILPVKKFRFSFNDTEIKTNGEEIRVPDFPIKAGVTRGMISRMISYSTLKETAT